MGCPPPLDAVPSEQVHSSSICPCASIREVDSLRLSEDHPPSVRIFASFHAHSGVSVGFFAPCVRPRCCGPPPVSEICSQPNFRIRRNHIWVLIMQKTFQQDVINRKAIKNTGQLPMYLIENHHEGIVSREKYDAVQAEMARWNAAKSPSKRASTGLAAYTSRYALSDRLVCGECGTLYRRCTWTHPDGKRVVWRCVSRLDYGKKYCHSSPTLDEAPLQQAIIAALNTVLPDLNGRIRQITEALEAEVIPFPGSGMSIGDIDRRLAELEAQFQRLPEKAVPHIAEWDESAVRQLVAQVKVLSKSEISVMLKSSIEIGPVKIYAQNCLQAPAE